MARRGQQQYRREQINLDNQYAECLDQLVDDIYEAATDVYDYSWYQLAYEAHLAYNTVHRLGMRETKLPRLKTLFKLAAAVGMDVGIIENDLRARAVA